MKRNFERKTKNAHNNRGQMINIPTSGGMTMKITLTRIGCETVTAKEVKFEFHHFRVTVDDCKALENDITLANAYEQGRLSATCCVGLKGRYKTKMQGTIRRLARTLAKTNEQTISIKYEG